jgi:hypothetical protein
MGVGHTESSGKISPPGPGRFNRRLKRPGDFGAGNLFGYVPMSDVVFPAVGVASEARSKGGHPKLQIFIRNNDLAEQIEHKKPRIRTGEKRYYMCLYRRLRGKL